MRTPGATSPEGIPDSSNQIFTTLRATPDLMADIAAIVEPEVARTRPTPSRWSVLEIVAHLAEVEREVMRVRAQRMVEEDSPLLASYDQVAECEAGRFNERDIHTELQRFAALREENLAWLQRLAPEDWQRKGQHAELGEITLANLLNEWALHDIGHMRQILEIQRARFWNNMGAFQRFYKVNP